MANSPVPEGLTVHEIVTYAKADDAKKKIEKVHKPLNEKIKELFVKKGTFTYSEESTNSKGEIFTDTAVVVLGESNRFDAAAAEAAFPYEDFPDYYKPTFDPTALDEKTREQYKSKVKTLSVKLVTE